MVRAIGRWAAAAVLGGALMGCTRTVVQQKAPPPDPLLVTRRPVEGRPRPDDLSARLQPPAPPSPLGEPAGDPDAQPVRQAQMRLEWTRPGGQ